MCGFARFPFLVVLAAASATAGATPPCPASPYASIQAAIDAAPNGGTVTVCDGTFFENLTVSGKTLTLASANGSAVTTVDAQGLGTALTVTAGANLTVTGFTFANGVTAGVGGNVSCSASTLALADSLLRDGDANTGGGLGATDCTGTIEDSAFEGNSAWQGGGAWISGDFLDFQRNTVTGNHADDSGGGVYVDGDSDLFDNDVESNDSDLYGGGIFVNLGDGDVSSNYIGWNTSLNDGAGLYINEGTALVSGNTIEGNDSSDDGGGLRLKLSTAQVLDNVLIGNHADNTGGGAKISHEETTIAGNLFSGNSSWVTGGGLSLVESASEVADNAFIGNTAPDGAGLFLVNGWDAVTVEDCNFVGNEATGHGGAIYASIPGQQVRLRRLVLDRGIADQGGGIYAIGTDLDISNLVIRRNEAWTAGGAIYLSGATGTIANIVAWSNSSPGGSGLRVSAGAVLDVANSVFGGGSGGPAVYLSSGSAPTWRYNDMFKNGTNFQGMANPVGVDGNLAVNPLFVNPKKGRFALQVGSPLIDAGDPAILDIDGTVSDIGRYGGPLE
jgi:predicted outer membrane repeat protein